MKKRWNAPRAAEAMQMVASIARANEVYKLANGSYTTDISLLDIQVPGCGYHIRRLAA